MRKLENLLDESTEGESGNMEKNVTQEEIANQKDSTSQLREENGSDLLGESCEEESLNLLKMENSDDAFKDTEMVNDSLLKGSSGSDSEEDSDEED